MKIALLGLPRSGKTTLFGALAGIEHPRPSHRLHEPLVATIPVPDGRLDQLRQELQPKRCTPASLTVEDFAGYPCEEEAEGKLRFIAGLREADAFALVLRAFTDVALGIPPDLVADRQTLETEMALGDLLLVERRLEKLQAELRKPRRDRERELQEKELAALERLHPALEEGKTILEVELAPEEERLLRGFAFLTAKPRLVVLNCAEGTVRAHGSDHLRPGEEEVRLVAPLERELACLHDPGELTEFMEVMEVEEVALPRLVRAAYATLGLASFFTTAGDELRAWTIPLGCPAVEAAGKVHTDMQRGFIRAEVIAFEDYQGAGSLKAARPAMRLEGKEYPVADGDIVNFRFSV
jgi:GTP-binding protein YchF